MNNPKILNGVLMLPHWTARDQYGIVPHRSRTIAFHKKGRREFHVCRNRKGTLFWVHALGPGFAGDVCRHSDTSITRSAKTAAIWAEMVHAGKVEVAD